MKHRTQKKMYDLESEIIIAVDGHHKLQREEFNEILLKATEKTSVDLTVDSIINFEEDAVSRITIDWYPLRLTHHDHIIFLHNLICELKKRSMTISIEYKFYQNIFGDQNHSPDPDPFVFPFDDRTN
jgi:hypothetical protein